MFTEREVLFFLLISTIPFFPCAVLITKIILITFLSNKIDNVSQHCHSLCGVLLSHTSVGRYPTSKVWQGSNLRPSNKFVTLPSELHTLLVRKRIFFMKHQLSPNTCGKLLILYKQVFFFVYMNIPKFIRLSGCTPTRHRLFER